MGLREAKGLWAYYFVFERHGIQLLVPTRMMKVMTRCCTMISPRTSYYGFESDMGHIPYTNWSSLRPRLDAADYTVVDV
ncbi:hypothetical protein Moror_9597 [Moniliophthora roreri MCA 2997]|uniref:Uncharacterized protein n=1 Tax=Moniliophthora roreri (strain MCA 2997) TaxID=1381753 RepID=V2XE11_MONRO|nr:hypothetical protein Moror_9597 [Moniliophthora roreri MCA 2997]KAI3610056.1 hypothetical protein WG66_007398 [Moniliophthora roreri]